MAAPPPAVFVKNEPPVTYVEAQSKRRRFWLSILALIMLLLMLAGLVLAILGVYFAIRLQKNSAEKFPDIVAHFERGSIGADEGSGLPYWVWQALPRLFPEQFNGRLDYSAFGFLYRNGADGKPEDLPIGISKRNYQGVDL